MHSLVKNYLLFLAPLQPLPALLICTITLSNSPVAKPSAMDLFLISLLD